MRFLGLITLSIWLVACAGSPPSSQQTPNEKDFGVPTDLASKFEVKETGASAAAAQPPAPASETTSIPVKPAKGAKGKPSKKNAKAAEKPKAGAKVEWPNRWGIAPFFQAGERYLFDITYFGATAGQLELHLMPEKVVAERPVFHIRALARTSSVFSLFYSMNDVAESFMDTIGLFSHKFTLKLDESLQKREVLELYDQRGHKVHYWSKLDHKKKGKINDQSEIPTEPFTQDGLSAFFYLRTLPLTMGSVYEFPVVTNGRLRNVRVTVVRKETIKTKIGEVPAIVVKPEVVLDGVLKTYGDNFVWISDDSRRVILKIDAKIKVGSIIAYLKEHGYAGSTGSQQASR